MKNIKYICTVVFTVLFVGAPGLYAEDWQASKKSMEKIFQKSFASTKTDENKEFVRSVDLTSYHKSQYSENSDKYIFRAEGLPEGAVFDMKEMEVQWDNTRKPLGNYTVVIYGETGEVKDKMTISIEVVDNWQSFFLPAVGYSVYMPETDKVDGLYQGVNIQFAYVSWIHHNENKGPSHGQWYFFLDLMQSDIKDVKDAFIYGTGVNMSFERNPKRKFLLPYFGLAFGWINQERINTRFFLNPEVGLWLYADKNIYVNAKFGYMLPTTKTEDFQGLRACLSVNFSMW